MLSSKISLPRKLAVYIHWPFCMAKCPYCDFNSHVQLAIDENIWRDALIKELEFMHEKTAGVTVSSIFFGGGTPSLMRPSTVEALIRKIHDLWPVQDDIEITLEANPTSVETGSFYSFRAAGVNRLSLGVQSLRDDELRFLGRGHSAAEAISSIKLAAKIFPRYSFDLIYARPEQDVRQWQKELSKAIELAGGHLSLYQLTIEKNTAFYNKYKSGGFVLPDEETAAELYMATEEIMLARGFISYEISNYAKVGHESRHNLSYWLGDSYIGVGAGAHGRIENIGAGGVKKRIATNNIKSPQRWLEKVQNEGNGLDAWQEISCEAEIEERVMMGLRLRCGIRYQDFFEQTGCNLSEHVNIKKRDLYTVQGLLVDDKDSLAATLKGRLVLNELIAELLSV